MAKQVQSDISKMSSFDSGLSKTSSLDSIFSSRPSLSQSEFELAILESNNDPDKTNGEQLEQLRWYKNHVTKIIRDYFSFNDKSEVIHDVRNLGFPEYNPTFVKKLITMAMEHKNKEKLEMTSSLISEVSMEVFTTDDVLTGFTLLLQSIEDTMLDIPHVCDQLALFLARAVVDDVLPPVYLDILAAKFPAMYTDTATANKTVELAREHALAPHAGQTLEKCWGWCPDVAWREADENIVNLLGEYQSDDDLNKVMCSIRHVAMPIINPIIVKRALISAMDESNTEKMLELLRACHAECLITETQMMLGYDRLAKEMNDFVFAIPDVTEKYHNFFEHAQKNGWFAKV